MARGVNKVILVGNCGQDPETKYMPSGGAVTNVSVATSEQWKDKQTGQPQERVEWHRVVFFNRLAEIAGEYLRKGSQVYIEGSLRTRKWQGQDGQDRYTTEIVASEMQMLGTRGESLANGSHGGSYREATNGAAARQPAQGTAQNPSRPAPPPNQPQGTHQRQAPPTPAPNYGQDPGFDAFDDDIPFDLAYRGMELAV